MSKNIRYSLLVVLSIWLAGCAAVGTPIETETSSTTLTTARMMRWGEVSSPNLKWSTGWNILPNRCGIWIVNTSSRRDGSKTWND